MLQAILLFIILYQIFFWTKSPEIVIDLVVWFSFVNGSVEIDNDWCSTAYLRAHTCLNTVQLLPCVVIGSFAENAHEPSIVDYLHNILISIAL